MPKRPRSPSLATVASAASSTPSSPQTVSHHSPPSLTESTTLLTSKKLKLQASYTTQSPFPDYPHPTPGEALDVYNLLAVAHGNNPTRPTQNLPIIFSSTSTTVTSTTTATTTTANSAESCGQVPNVIEAVIGTILSQNTSGANSAKAKQRLDETFGKNNFENIVNAPTALVVDAIRTGGLANKKAGMIQGLLRAVKERHGVYSLQHLAAKKKESGRSVMSDEEIMQELLMYDGVGPKTASCVLLFCLERDSFAVDTHVYRLSRLLGWVPLQADRVLAQAHLDLRVPPELKYGLHVLMIQHGRTCKGCNKLGGSGEKCVLKRYLSQSGR